MKQISNNISVLIPDGETKLLHNVVYSLSLVKKLKIYVMSSHKHKYFSSSLKNDCIKHSRYIERFIFFEETCDDEWIAHIDRLVETYNIDLIIPILDFGIKRIIDNKLKLKAKDRLCVLPESADFEKARNKDSLYLHLESTGLPHPKSIIFDQNNRFENINFEFPVIAKPVVGSEGGKGVKLLRNGNDVSKYLKSNVNGTNILFQEYIEGYDMSCNVLCDKGEILAYTMQEGVDRENVKVTPQYEFVFVNEKSVLVTLKKLMKSLNWSGVANIDFRYDKNEGVFKVIEINTRFWLNTEASALAGVNFPYLHCLLSLKEKFEFSEAKEMRFLHLKALLKRLSKNPLFVLKIRYIRQNTSLLFAIKDPLVLACNFFWRTTNILSSRVFNKKVP